MNETTTQGLIAAIIDVMIQQNPAAAAAMKPRMEAVASKAKKWGWQHDAEIVETLIGRLKV